MDGNMFRRENERPPIEVLKSLQGEYFTPEDIKSFSNKLLANEESFILKLSLTPEQSVRVHDFASIELMDGRKVYIDLLDIIHVKQLLHDGFYTVSGNVSMNHFNEYTLNRDDVELAIVKAWKNSSKRS